MDHCVLHHDYSPNCVDCAKAAEILDTAVVDGVYVTHGELPPLDWPPKIAEEPFAGG